jgi:arylsulfatase A
MKAPLGILLFFSLLFVSLAEKPNVIIIFIDDQGYYDLSCYGATEIETPRIDGMAKEGIRFTDYYSAAPICSPSRAGLLTGCYPRRVGMETWVQRADSNRGLNPDELTIAELFKENGYATACIGKWHLGFGPQFHPLSQGFDSYFGLLHNLDPVEVIYFEDEGGVPLMRDHDEVKRPADAAELTRIYTDEAIAVMERAGDEPFFIYLPHTMLHNPLGVSEEFQGTSQWGEYGDAIHELDFNVGRIFDALERLDIEDETIVVYASDNGRGPGRNKSQPIRGGKISTYEGGLRVPGIVWGPGLGIRSGHESSAVVRAMDWYPTLATFAGIRVPEGRVIDGRDISPLLLGKSDSVPPPSAGMSLNADLPLRRNIQLAGEWAPLMTVNEYNDAFFYHGSHGALAAIRWDKWKMVLNPRKQLFDLEADPGESKPVGNREINRKLLGMVVTFQEEMSRHARRAGFSD